MRRSLQQRCNLSKEMKDYIVCKTSSQSTASKKERLYRLWNSIIRVLCTTKELVLEIYEPYIINTKGGKGKEYFQSMVLQIYQTKNTIYKI
jgi:hypothetical protein